MRLFYSPNQLAHRPQQFMMAGRIVPAFDIPERAASMAASLAEAGLPVIDPGDHGAAPITAVHAGHYVAFLREAHARFSELPNAGPEVLPNVHPHFSATRGEVERPAPRPTGIVGRAGWYVGDLACAIGAGTWDATYASAQAAIAAARDVLSGAHAAFALCRPPGHHAYADRASGHCFLNNAAIGAELLRTRFGRVAIADFDTHHGDGTQAIFYARADVLYASLHTDPAVYYPYFAGYADERGIGAGEGANLNLPLSPGAGDDAFVEANRALAAAVTAFRADALVLSAGWDAHRNDPLSKLAVTTDAFQRAGEIWGALGLPTLIVQEGGYSLGAIEAVAPRFAAAFLGARK